MAIYRLWRLADDKNFELDATSDQSAVDAFGRDLGAQLTLEEGPAAPQYMMQVMKKEPGFTPPPDISVWEKGT